MVLILKKSLEVLKFYHGVRAPFIVHVKELEYPTRYSLNYVQYYFNAGAA